MLGLSAAHVMNHRSWWICSLMLETCFLGNQSQNTAFMSQWISLQSSSTMKFWATSALHYQSPTSLAIFPFVYRSTSLHTYTQRHPSLRVLSSARIFMAANIGSHTFFSDSSKMSWNSTLPFITGCTVIRREFGEGRSRLRVPPKPTGAINKQT